MKLILKKLLDAKNGMRKAQDQFSEGLEKKFPVLVGSKTDTNKSENLLEKELEFLLSSAVTIKTGKVIIQTKKLGYYNKLVLTRNPGLKVPYTSYASISLINTKEIKNGDLYSVSSYEQDSIVMLSDLKNHRHIDSEKLEKFYGFLKEGIGWEKTLKEFLEPKVPEGSKNISGGYYTAGKNRVMLSSQDFKIDLRDKEGQFINLNLREMKEYDVGYGGSEVRVRFNNLLEMFWKDYETFEVVLTNLENRKREILKIVNEIIERIKEYNRPFKVLEQLKKNAI